MDFGFKAVLVRSPYGVKSGKWSTGFCESGLYVFTSYIVWTDDTSQVSKLVDILQPFIIDGYISRFLCTDVYYLGLGRIDAKSSHFSKGAQAIGLFL